MDKWTARAVRLFVVLLAFVAAAPTQPTLPGSPTNVFALQPSQIDHSAHLPLVPNQYSPPSHVYLRSWGAEHGFFEEPTGIAILGELVYVSDRQQHIIQVFDMNGTLLSVVGEPGYLEGQFHYPHRVAVDAAGAIYVADTNNDRVQVFTPEGIFLRQWRNRGTDPGQFDYPQGIAVDAAGVVYVADRSNKRIQVFAPDYPTPDPVHGLALNGSFEETPDWTRWGYGGDLPISLVGTATHGSRAALLGEPVPAAPQPYGKAWLRQTIYVRPEWARPTLRFVYRMFVNDVVDRSDFSVRLSRPDGIKLADVVRDGYTDPSAPTSGYDLGWRTASYDLSAFKGQHVRLIFEVRNLLHNQSLGIWTLVDDVRVVDAGQ